MQFLWKVNQSWNDRMPARSSVLTANRSVVCSLNNDICVEKWMDVLKGCSGDDDKALVFLVCQVATAVHASVVFTVPVDSYDNKV